jgi:hypothetical protein
MGELYMSGKTKRSADECCWCSIWRQSTVTGAEVKKQIDQRIRDNRRISIGAGLIVVDMK